MSQPEPSDPRAEARTAWTRAILRDPGAIPVRASMDAGFRSYWRVAGADGSRIVMDSPPDKEDVRPWLRIRDVLEAGGVRVPQVLARDVDAGFLLLEDLGADTYLHVIDATNADALFDAAASQLLKLQAIAPPADLPAYDEALLARELRLFDEWFCGTHLGLSLQRAETVKREIAQRAPKLRKNLTSAGAGSREMLVGTGRDDLSDALDRRVEFKVKGC